MNLGATTGSLALRLYESEVVSLQAFLRGMLSTDDGIQWKRGCVTFGID